VSVRITGLGRTLTRIARIPRAAREAREDVLEDWADDTQSLVKNRTPVHSGALKNNIDKKVFSDAAYVGVWKPEQLEYAEYVEKGTSSMEAQPYLTTGFEAGTNRAEIARKWRAEIRRRLGA